MFYKTIAARLHHCGWTITDESHGAPGEWGRLIPHYVEFSDNIGNTVSIAADHTKNGNPGRVMHIWVNGASCDLPTMQQITNKIAAHVRHI